VHSRAAPGSPMPRAACSLFFRPHARTVVEITAAPAPYSDRTLSVATGFFNSLGAAKPFRHSNLRCTTPRAQRVAGNLPGNCESANLTRRLRRYRAPAE
jgi:hypothetical protein